MQIPSKKKFDEIREKYGLELLLLHGSHVTGKLHPESDVDIAVLPASNDFDLLGLIGELVETIGVNKIDVTNLKNANPLLLFSVARNSKLLSGSEVGYDDFKLRAFRRYCDYLPYLRMEEKFIREEIENYVTT